MRTITLALALAGTAQTSPVPPAPPVHIDAVIADPSGRFVETLGLEEFDVVENGRPRAVTGVQLVKANGALEPGETARPIDSQADEQVQAAREGTRLFAIFLDEYHVSPGEGATHARELLTTFVDRALGPRDLLLIVKPLDSLLALRMTRDREAVRQAIARFEGRKGSYEPKSALERSIFAGDRSRIDAVRAQVVISALNAIATHLGWLSVARKALLVVSEGFATPARRRGDGGLPTLDAVIGAANRATVAIYPIDPRALHAGLDRDVRPRAARDTHDPAWTDRDLLARLAAATDGFAVLRPADVAPGIERIVRDTSHYYLLTLAGAPGEADGSFHPVEVRVHRRGVQVRARRGYWAATPDDLFRARLAAHGPEPAAPALLPRRASPLIRPWFGLTRGAGGEPHVSFVWEPAGRVPGERAGASAPARVAFKALASDGTTVYEGVVRPSGPAIGVSDMPALLVFPAPPGRLRVQLSIEDATSRVLDTDVRDVVVRPLSGPLALGTPQVLRSRTAREHRLLEADPAAAPTASREFSRTERLWVRVPMYAPDDAPRPSARLLSAIGGVMRELTVQPTPVAAVYQVDLPLAGLAAGEYSVEIGATIGGAETKELVTFRVTP